jgi:hypothetical protein
MEQTFCKVAAIEETVQRPSALRQLEHELAEFARPKPRGGIAGRQKLFPTIADALRIERVLHAISRSAAERRWIRVEEVD